MCYIKESILKRYNNCFSFHAGAHTIGRANCSLLLLFALNNVDINPDFNSTVFQECLANTSSLQNLDLTTPDDFDNNYYGNLLNSEGLLISDQTLFSTPGAASVAVVQNFASNQDAFFSQFALSTINMGNIKPLTGDQGEIRTNCRVVNSASPARLIAYQWSLPSIRWDINAVEGAEHFIVKSDLDSLFAGMSFALNIVYLRKVYVLLN